MKLSAKLPPSVQGLPLTKRGTSVEKYLVDENGCTLVSRGKVRDLYRFKGDKNRLLFLASDRLSIFDFVLPATVPYKGEILTALSHFWTTQVLTPYKNHMLPPEIGGVSLSHFYPELPMERVTLVKEAEKIQPYELIYRAYLGGSVRKDYEKTGIVAGQSLPKGLKKWQELDEPFGPIFTPSTKSEEGHDENITVGRYYQEVGHDLANKTELALKAAYKTACEFARDRGIVILDTKFEASTDPWMIADEILTPDSSRFTTVEDYEAAMVEGRDPVFYDKEPVRAWGRTVVTPFDEIIGINNLDPSNDAHVAFVHSLTVPEDVIADTTKRYRQIFGMLTGMILECYQKEYMGIAA